MYFKILGGKFFPLMSLSTDPYNVYCMLKYPKSIFNIFFRLLRRLHEKDEARALFVLLQSPVFSAQSSYTILAHLLKAVVSVPASDLALLVSWLRT